MKQHRVTCRAAETRVTQIAVAVRDGEAYSKRTGKGFAGAGFSGRMKDSCDGKATGRIVMAGFSFAAGTEGGWGIQSPVDRRQPRNGMTGRNVTAIPGTTVTLEERIKAVSPFG